MPTGRYTLARNTEQRAVELGGPFDVSDWNNHSKQVWH
jgi:hypothetical protein